MLCQNSYWHGLSCWIICVKFISTCAFILIFLGGKGFQGVLCNLWPLLHLNLGLMATCINMDVCYLFITLPLCSAVHNLGRQNMRVTFLATSIVSFVHIVSVLLNTNVNVICCKAWIVNGCVDVTYCLHSPRLCICICVRLWYFECNKLLWTNHDALL